MPRNSYTGTRLKDIPQATRQKRKSKANEIQDHWRNQDR